MAISSSVISPIPGIDWVLLTHEDRGSSMINSVPVPTNDRQIILPWCRSSMIWRLTDKPIPLPCNTGFVINKSSKIAFWTSSDIPKLLSWIDKSVWSVEIVADFSDEECIDRAYVHHYEFKDIITSWPFIEAIARGILFNKQDWNSFNKQDFLIFWISDENIIKTITHSQADAIRDNKLDEFIQDLLPKK